MFTQNSIKDYPDAKIIESISLSSLPYIPAQVVKHLKHNLKLLDEKKIEFIKKELSKEPYGRYSKLRFEIPYGIFYSQDGIFAIYNKSNKFYHFFWPKKNQIILGSGTFGYVKLAQNLETGEWKALKIEALNKKNKQLFFSECNTLNKLGQTKDDKGLIKTSQKSHIKKGNVLMDFAIGDQLLDLHMNREKKDSKQFWPELIWLDIAIQSAKALKDLHDKNLLHRDVKLDNFIWDNARKKLTLIDFGFTDECKLDSKGNKFLEDVFWAPGNIVRRNFFPKQKLQNTKFVLIQKKQKFML